MRSVFDQYQQPENQLTHALVCTLDADRSLLRPFLKWLGAKDVPRTTLRITQQQVPGVLEPGEDEQRGLPDACIFSDAASDTEESSGGWAVLIESKVQSGIGLDQLNRHKRTAERAGFPNAHLVLLAVDRPKSGLPKGVEYRPWREVYAWFRARRGESEWAGRLTQYMEAFERRMIARDYAIRGTITMFDGIGFDENNPYTYAEAKRLIRLLGDELQNRPKLLELGVDPKGERRSAITGRSGGRVWDFLPLKDARGATSFTAFPHLTMVVSSEHAVAAVTVPNGVKGGFKTKIKECGQDGFMGMLQELAENTHPILRDVPQASVFLYAVQRHFPSQRSAGIVDAETQADLRTIDPGSTGGVKYQPQWAHAIYDVLAHKRSNVQFGVRMHFPYTTKGLRSPQAVELFERSWLAFSPLLRFVLE
jgi:hypothetical protein